MKASRHSRRSRLFYTICNVVIPSVYHYILRLITNLRALCVVDFLQFLSRLLRESLLFSNVKGRQKCARDFYCFARLCSIERNMPLYREDVNVFVAVHLTTIYKIHYRDFIFCEILGSYSSGIIFFSTSYYSPSLCGQFYCVYSTCHPASCRYFDVDS